MDAAAANPLFPVDFAFFRNLPAVRRAPRRRWAAAWVFASAILSGFVAEAQIHIYPRRGTVFSNDMAAMAEYRAADGQYTRDAMEAYRVWVAAERERLILEYERYQIREAVRMQKVAASQARIEARRKQRANATSSAATASPDKQELGAWPVALQRPKYMTSVLRIQSIFVMGHLSDPDTADWAERAIATEAGVVRATLLADGNLTAGQQDEALTMLELVTIRAQSLAMTTRPAATLAAAESAAGGSVRGASIP